MKRKTLKRFLLIVVILGLIGASYAAYLFFMPHRDVQNTKAFSTMVSVDLVNEFLTDFEGSNNKYLSTDGDSKVLIVSGTVYSTSVDQNGQVVILLKDKSNEAGVSCTFLKDLSVKVSDFNIDDKVKVKGAIRSGASYDEDFEMFEDVILEDCNIIK